MVHRGRPSRAPEVLAAVIITPEDAGIATSEPEL